MKVADNDVAYVADLANLALTPEERGRMVRDLNSILDYMDQLNELDTTNVPPMTKVSLSLDSSEHSYREDVVEGLRPSLPQSEALRNAPASDGTYFKVPKVIER